MSAPVLIQVLSLTGAAAVLLAFALLEFGRGTLRQRQWLNIVGAALLCTSATVGQIWGFAILNAVWFAIALRGLWRPVPRTVT